MKKILALGGSNSSKSINKAAAQYAAGLLENVEVEVLDLASLDLPLYSADLEEAQGIPEAAHQFISTIAAADGIVLSLAEHNGLPTAAFKNLWDWASRVEKDIWQNKPMLLMAASPGGRGGANVLSVISNLMPHFAGNVVGTFSLPGFHTNFQNGALVQESLLQELTAQVGLLQKNL